MLYYFFVAGAPLIIHPGRGAESPFRIIEVLAGAGADIGHTVMSHLDRTIFDNDKLIEFAKLGCYLEYDLFGIECSHYQVTYDITALIWYTTGHLLLTMQFTGSIDFPSDAEKIAKVKYLVDNGYADRVLLSHDIHTKHRLVRLSFG